MAWPGPAASDDSKNCNDCMTFSFSLGLELRYNSQNLDEENHFKSFSYTPAIGIPPADWHILTMANLERAHIRVHELSDGDNLLKCAESYQENHAKAMIVINTTEDYSLIPELNYSLHTVDNFFVAILPHGDGMALLDYLQCKDSPEVIYARYISNQGVL